MRILVAAASFSSEMSGIQRHAFNVVRCLLKRPDVTAVDLVVAPWQLKLVQSSSLPSDARLSTHIADMDLSSVSRNLWYYRKLPELAASWGADVVHLSYPMPVSRSAFRCPVVVSLHDLYPYEIPRNFGFPKFIFNRATLQQCLRNVDAIACVSDATREQLKKYTSAKIWSKSVRIYNCVEPPPLRAIRSPIPHWHGEPLILSVAQHRRNKNLPLLIRTYIRLLDTGKISSDTRLAIIGIRGPETRKIEDLVYANNVDGKVHLLEGLSEDELQWCYTHCEAVVVPSSTEGFGLSVAEALMSGCRVVCSDIAALREVGGSHCTFVSLEGDAVGNLGEGIVRALQAPLPRPVPMPQLSTDVLAGQYLELYRKLVPDPGFKRSSVAVGSLCSVVPGQDSL